MTADDTALALTDIAIAKEATPGTAEAAPDVYILCETPGIIDMDRSKDLFRAASGRDYVLHAMNGYTTACPMTTWAFPNINGLGEALTAFYGGDVAAQQGGTVAYKHTFSLANSLPSYTIWEKTSQWQRQSVLNKLNKLTINSAQNKEVTVQMDWVGGRWVKNADVLTTAYCTTDTVFHSMGATFTFGQAGAAIRAQVTDATLNFENGFDPKAGITHGRKYPNTMVGGDRNLTGNIKFWVTDDDEVYRACEGVATDPSATEPGDRVGLVPLNIKWTGPLIAGAYYYELEIDYPYVLIDMPKLSESGARFQGDMSFTAVKGAGSTLSTAYLTNLYSSAY